MTVCCNCFNDLSILFTPFIIFLKSEENLSGLIKSLNCLFNSSALSPITKLAILIGEVKGANLFLKDCNKKILLCISVLLIISSVKVKAKFKELIVFNKPSPPGIISVNSGGGKSDSKLCLISSISIWSSFILDSSILESIFSFILLLLILYFRCTVY